MKFWLLTMSAGNPAAKRQLPFRSIVVVVEGANGVMVSAVVKAVRNSDTEKKYVLFTES